MLIEGIESEQNETVPLTDKGPACPLGGSARSWTAAHPDCLNEEPIDQGWHGLPQQADTQQGQHSI